MRHGFLRKLCELARRFGSQARAKANNLRSIRHARPLGQVRRGAASSVTTEAASAPFVTLRAKGLNVIGYVNAESGVGESARATIRAALAAGIRVAVTDFRLGNTSRMQEAIPDACETGQPFGINLFHINADQTLVAHCALGSHVFSGFYNIGYWAWELPEFPDEWLGAFEPLDEVWVPSTFCQQAIAAKAPIPVVAIPHSVAFGSRDASVRRHFRLPDDAFVFLVMADVLSIPERKNPLGAIEAFRRAFAKDMSSGVRLIVKLSNLEQRPDVRESLDRVTGDDPRITLIEGYLERTILKHLLGSVDCFVSIHRSEGFGLGLAEAMACGVPTIATGWSGNMDFTTPWNSLLVDYALQPLQASLGPYKKGQIWAEPDLDDAALKMRAIASDDRLWKKLSSRGRELVEQKLLPHRVGALVRSRIEAIQRSPATHPRHRVS
jgi:glycosyltransferase involved in cell wall biosynthesis